MTNSEKVLAAIAARYGTQDAAQLQIQRWNYFDSVRLPVAGTNRLTFFSNPIGSVDPVSGLAKTLEETNIRRSGELDLPFVIMTIGTRIELLPVGRQHADIQAVTNAVQGGMTAVHRALRNLANLGVLTVSFGQKNYVQIEQPFQKCPPGYGPSIRSIAGTTGATFPGQSLYYSQSVEPVDRYVVSPPTFVEKGQTLEANIDFLLANSTVIPQIAGQNVAVNVRLEFDGYVIRPVQ